MRRRAVVGKTSWKRVTSNAINFLSRAIDEFQTHPKHSVISFYSAVELFLKARLMHEHWSLIVASNADYQTFIKGDFNSVNFKELCERLKRIAQAPLPEQALKNFDAIRQHRNKMVHYFHEASAKQGRAMETIAKEQLRAWYDLNKLLTVQWAPLFQKYAWQLEKIEQKLAGHRAYLKVKFDDLAPELAALKAGGAIIRKCSSCAFDAEKIDDIVGDLHESRCLVCGYGSKWLAYVCPTCSLKGELQEGGRFVCVKCGHKVDERALVESINQFVATKDNYFEAVVPANCSDCDGYHTVVEYEGQYLCVCCLTVAEELHQCGWCSEHSNGLLEDSYLSGCGVCEGGMGHWASKDD